MKCDEKWRFWYDKIVKIPCLNFIVQEEDLTWLD